MILKKKCGKVEAFVARLLPPSGGGQTVCFWEKRQQEHEIFGTASEGQPHVGIGRYAQQRVKGPGWHCMEGEEHVAGKRGTTSHCIIRTPTQA